MSESTKPRLQAVGAHSNSASFDEMHPRAEAGTFSARAFSEHDLGFFSDFDTPERRLDDYADGDEILRVHPSNTAEVQDALYADQGDRLGRVHMVTINHPMASLDEAVVTGPSDGRPLLIDITAGSGSIVVKSGYVVVRMDSPGANEVHAVGTSSVIVIVGRGRTATVVASGESSAHVVGEPGAKGHLRVDSPNAIAEVSGETSGIKIAHTYRWNF